MKFTKSGLGNKVEPVFSLKSKFKLFNDQTPILKNKINSSQRTQDGKHNLAN